MDWELDTPRLVSQHINVKETMAVVAAIHRWAPVLQNSRVVVYTDNTTTRAHINKGACRNPQLMVHLRQLFWLSVLYNLEIVCIHIPGVDNRYADSISRLREAGHFLHWYSVFTGGMAFNTTTCFHLYQHHMSPQACKHLLTLVKTQYPHFKDG